MMGVMSDPAPARPATALSAKLRSSFMSSGQAPSNSTTAPLPVSSALSSASVSVSAPKSVPTAEETSSSNASPTSVSTFDPASKSARVAALTSKLASTSPSAPTVSVPVPAGPDVADSSSIPVVSTQVPESNHVTSSTSAYQPASDDSSQPVPTTPSTAPAAQTSLPSSSLSTATQLDVISQVLDEVEAGPAAQALPQVIDQATDTLNPATGISPSVKETGQAVFPEQSMVDAIPGGQMVEQEISPELPVEVESFMETVENTDHLAQEVTIAGDQISTTPIQHVAKQPVIVLPINQDEENDGAKKSVKLSFRWLVEWSRKIMKMFAGQVVYKETQ